MPHRDAVIDGNRVELAGHPPAARTPSKRTSSSAAGAPRLVQARVVRDPGGPGPQHRLAESPSSAHRSRSRPAPERVADRGISHLRADLAFEQAEVGAGRLQQQLVRCGAGTWWGRSRDEWVGSTPRGVGESPAVRPVVWAGGGPARFPPQIPLIDHSHCILHEARRNSPRRGHEHPFSNPRRGGSARAVL
jgi:hypothetical protein